MSYKNAELERTSHVYLLTFPECSTQVCVVHQIRNACRYVVWKDKKAFTADMKPIYDAANKQAAQAALADFANRWESKYPYAIRSCGTTGTN